MRPPEYRKGLEDLISYINTISSTKTMTMIEIGSYAGESTQIFSRYFDKVISIDPYINDYDPNDITCNYAELTTVYDTFKQVLDQHENIMHIRKTSDEAILDLLDIHVDFVYIDGLHTYEQVKTDIDNYLPIIVKSGFIAGHDFHPVWQGVIDAVLEKIGQPDSTFIDTSWIKQLKNI